MTIKRCDKCGKAYMSEPEVERHKMYEHPVPVSPLEERSVYDASEINGNLNMEDLQKMIANVTTSKTNSNNDITTIGGKQIKKVLLERLDIKKDLSINHIHSSKLCNSL
jgi:hypothetical protein